MTRFVLVVMLMSACGDNLAATPDAARPDAPSAFATAPHTPLPLLARHDGYVLHHPELVTITYANYAAAAQVEQFGDEVVASDWFQNAGREYGVGAGTHAAKVHLGAAPATLKDTDIETLMHTLVTNHTVPTPPATDSEYIYMIYIPPSVTLDASLQGFYGYHQDTTLGATRFAFAVILDDGSGIDTTTSTAAHELIETATDPYFVDGQLGWYIDPPADDPWYLIEGEIADVCDGEALIRSGNFAVQRTWSNLAAAAGQSPCVPYDPDSVWMDVSADPPTMPTIPAGGSATFTLTGWSTQQVGDWSLDEYTADFSDLYDTDMNPTFSTKIINNGKTAQLTLHAPASARSGDFGGIYVLSGDQIRPWAVGFVVQ